MEDSVFPATNWSDVRAAAAGNDPAAARRAFEDLCGAYHKAITRWMHLQRLTPEDADDASQDFLHQWLKRENPLQGFVKGERCFREFLRVCLRRFLADWHARRNAIQRGGQAIHVPWEHDEEIEDTSEAVPLIDLALAANVHQEALRQLASAWEAQISGSRFERLCAVALGQAENPGYGALASELGVAVGTLKSWIFRLRREYYNAFRSAVSRQVEPELVDTEIHYFQDLLGRALSPEQQKSGGESQPPEAASR